MTKLIGDKIILEKNNDWPQDESKQLVAMQFAGGHQNPMKGKYNLIFPEEVTKYIDTLVKP